MGEEKEILLRGKVCAYLTCRLSPFSTRTGREQLDLLLPERKRV